MSMRRAAFAEPPSRLALWSPRIVFTGMAVAAVAVMAARSDWLDGAQAVTALTAGLVLAGLGVAVAAAGGIVIWRTGYGGARHAVLALLAGLAVLAYPVSLAAIGLQLPALVDVTTDPADPPAFDIAAAARPPTANPPAYRPGLAMLQRRLYPEIRPLDVDLPAEAVNAVVADLVEARRWRILDRVDYRGAAREGRFEMVTRSLIMGFRDDIVIRIRHAGGRARIDMRSAARYGQQDFGANARRVIAALDEMRIAARRAQRQSGN